MNDAYYDFIMHLTAGIAFFILVLAVLFFRHRNRIEKQRTIQKLIDKDCDITPDLLNQLGLKTQRSPQADLRRGVLLLSTGLILTATFKLIGGIIWIFGFLPVIIGLVYIAFSRLQMTK